MEGILVLSSNGENLHCFTVEKLVRPEPCHTLAETLTMAPAAMEQHQERGNNKVTTQAALPVVFARIVH